jgi:hypothetical protein
VIWAVLLGWAAFLIGVVWYYAKIAMTAESQPADDIRHVIQGLIRGFLGMWYIVLTLKDPEFCDGTGWEENGAIIAVISVAICLVTLFLLFLYSTSWAL